nr:MAG TPA: Protein of unknown function (DUF722) [Caudoviricetes sp.]
MKITRQDLESIYYLRKDQKRLESLIEVEKAKAEKCTASMSITPGGSSGNKLSVEDKYITATEKYINELIDIKNQIAAKVIVIERFINHIPEPFYRLLLHYRCVECLPFKVIADKLGGKNTADSVRKAYIRYLEKIFQK